MSDMEKDAISYLRCFTEATHGMSIPRDLAKMLQARELTP